MSEELIKQGECTTWDLQSRYSKLLEVARKGEQFIKQLATWECCCADGGEPTNCRCGDIMIDMAREVMRNV